MTEPVSFRLQDGFDLSVIRVPHLRTVWFDLAVRRPLGPDATRLAVLERVLSSGCRGFPHLRAIHRFLEGLYGASFSSGVEKLGREQILTLRLRVLDDRWVPRPARAIERALRFLYRVLTAPLRRGETLDPAIVEREKTNHARTLASLVNNRPLYAWMRCVELMCAGEPYGIPECGRASDLPGITPGTLTEFHSGLLRTAPVELIVAGDVDPDRIRRAVSRTFRRFCARRDARTSDSEDRPREVAPMREASEHVPLEQARIVIAWRSRVTLRDDAFPSLAALGTLFGGSAHSRLMRNVREKEGLTYDAGTFLEPVNGFLFASLGTDPERARLARDLVLREWESLRAGRIEPDELAQTRELLAHEVRSAVDSPGRLIREARVARIGGRRWGRAELLEAIGRLGARDIQAAAQATEPAFCFFLLPPATP